MNAAKQNRTALINLPFASITITNHIEPGSITRIEQAPDFGFSVKAAGDEERTKMYVYVKAGPEKANKENLGEDIKVVSLEVLNAIEAGNLFDKPTVEQGRVDLSEFAWKGLDGKPTPSWEALDPDTQYAIAKNTAAQSDDGDFGETIMKIVHHLDCACRDRTANGWTALLPKKGKLATMNLDRPDVKVHVYAKGEEPKENKTSRGGLLKAMSEEGKRRGMPLPASLLSIMGAYATGMDTPDQQGRRIEFALPNGKELVAFFEFESEEQGAWYDAQFLADLASKEITREFDDISKALGKEGAIPGGLFDSTPAPKPWMLSNPRVVNGVPNQKDLGHVFSDMLDHLREELDMKGDKWIAAVNQYHLNVEDSAGYKVSPSALQIARANFEKEVGMAMLSPRVFQKAMDVLGYDVAVGAVKRLVEMPEIKGVHLKSSADRPDHVLDPLLQDSASEKHDAKPDGQNNGILRDLPGAYTE